MRSGKLDPSRRPKGVACTKALGLEAGIKESESAGVDRSLAVTDFHIAGVTGKRRARHDRPVLDRHAIPFSVRTTPRDSLANGLGRKPRARRFEPCRPTMSSSDFAQPFGSTIFCQRLTPSRRDLAEVSDSLPGAPCTVSFRLRSLQASIARVQMYRSPSVVVGRLELLYRRSRWIE